MSEQKKWFINGEEFVSLNNLRHVELVRRGGYLLPDVVVLTYFDGVILNIKPSPKTEVTAEQMYQKIWAFI